MIFFDNCCPNLWAGQYLSIGRGLKLRFRPPRSYPILLSCIVFLLLSSAKGYANQITLSLKSVPLETAFEEIKKQSGYGFWYEKKDLEGLAKVTVAVTGAGLKQALDLCLKGQPLSYEIFDKTVVVKRKAVLPVAVPVKRALQEKVRGKVVDAQTKEPLAGVLVKFSAPEISVVTDDEGVFELNLPSGRYELVVQYMGYRNRVIVFDVPRESELMVGMEYGEQMLEEVKINAGYYQVRDRERTGAISRVNSETIQKQPVNNPLQALQGRVAGVEITQQTGVPGGGFKVQVRGRNSISSGNDPLYVINGVVYPSARLNNANSNSITQDASPLSMINPNDIQSIEVLKDADATAIYGSRGANGVILITTLKAGQDDFKINLNVQKGFSTVGNRVKMMDTKQYLAMRMEAFANDNINPSANDYDVNGVWDKNKYTDWQEELIGGNAGVTNVAVGASGGNAKASYLIGANHYREGTVFLGDFGFERNSMNFSLNLGETKDRLNIAVNANYGQTKSELMSTDPTLYINLAPNAPDLIDEFGKLNWKYNGSDLFLNPMALLHNTINATTNNVLGNINLSYRIVDGLVLKTSSGYNQVTREEISKRPNIAKSPAGNPTSANRETQFGNNSNHSWIVEPQLTYDMKFGAMKLSSLLGASVQHNRAEYRNIAASNFTSDELMDNIASASVFAVRESTFSTYKYAAIFGRLNLNMKDRYFLNLTARRDGSSRFGPGKQFANFFALGGAWIFSEESWLRDRLKFLNFGKLRASYGITGNDQIADYGYMQLYSNSGTYQGITTLNINRIANADYAWETNRKIELALELGMFRDIAKLQVSYFRNRSSNQLVGLPIPPSVGSISIQANLPAVVENTGVELDMQVKVLDSKRWKWQTSLNLTIPRNRLVRYPDLASTSNATNYIIGKPLAIIRYYDTNVDPQTGLYVFKDSNGNGIRDDADRYLNTFIGQQAYGGLNNSINFGNFGFDLLVSFVKQNGNSLINGISYPPGYFAPGIPNVNQPLAILERWRTAGDLAQIPKYSTLNAGISNFNLGKSMGAQAVGDASFIRLKNVAISYNLPARWLAGTKLSGVQLNLQGQNLFTITGYDGLDPENQSLSRLPPLRTLLAGVKANF